MKKFEQFSKEMYDEPEMENHREYITNYIENSDDTRRLYRIYEYLLKYFILKNKDVDITEFKNIILDLFIKIDDDDIEKLYDWIQETLKK